MRQINYLMAFLAVSTLLIGCCSDVRKDREKVPFGIGGEYESGGQGAQLGIKVIEKTTEGPPAAPSTEPAGDLAALDQKINALAQKHQADIEARDRRIAELEQMLRGQRPVATATAVSPGGLRIEHSGPQTGYPNSTVPFNLRVINPFSYPVHNVRLYAYLSDGVEFINASDGGQYNPQTRAIEWFFPNIEANGSRAVTYEVRVGGTGTYEVCAYATYELRECVSVRVVQPNLVCEVTSPPQGMVGTPFETCVVIRNTGDGPAGDVVAMVRLPQGLTFEDGTTEKSWPAGTVPAGGSVRQCWRVNAVSTGRFTIDVNVQGGGGLTTMCSSATDVTTPDLVINKTAPRRAHLGREFEYMIEVKNTGSAPATGTQLVDQLPEGVEFKAASEGGTYNGGSRTVSWNLGTLQPGESRSFTIRVKAMRENVNPGWTNTAKVSCVEGIVREDSAVTIVEAVPAMHIDSYDTEDPVQVGETTVYVITIRNEGQKDATQVQMRIKLPDQTTYMSHDGVTGIEAGSVKINGMYDAAGRTVVYDPIPVMRPGDSATYKVQIRVDGTGDELSTALLTFAEFSREITVQEPTKFYK